MKNRLYIFDMDGTLLINTTGLIELAKVLGTKKELFELEESFKNNELSTVEFTRLISILWGYIDPDLSHKAFSNAQKIYGISECLAIIKRNGGTSCLITMSQDIFSSHFKKYGFDFIFSSTYPPNTNGDIKILTPNDKPIISRSLCKIKNLKFEESIAFGDSLSDEPLFSLLTETIAINATETLKNISKYSYDGKSLLEAYSQLNID